ncbi:MULTISPECIES: helix-turn-helix domain-containing protein [unclassified Bradyrhizobium]|uniref:helix-turn-helix domain-containing protein n=1 Tax=unclassified Bradyrhizobium TaxID=2631580 RepID=UPI0028F0EA7E|nr:MULTISPECIES: helix-turn-helix domain-containing protein [unclassified Bradyrhizobium]
MSHEFTPHIASPFALDPGAIGAEVRPATEVVPLLIGMPLSEVERELIVQTLARCHGNRTHAARLLGMPVRTLRNKIRIYTADGVEVPAYGT